MYAAKVAGGLAARMHDSLRAGCDAVLVCDPKDVRELLSEGELAVAGADAALRRLKGRLTATREEVERVSEWRQWKKTITQLEMEQAKWV
jgi:beta-glucosidase-like glycosyl hydrolase